MYHDVYPVTIITTRYCGTYEGGALWVAFNDHCDSEALHGAMGGDIQCSTFFEVYERFKPIGRGQTPEEAYQDLARKLDEEPHKAWPNIR